MFTILATSRSFGDGDLDLTAQLESLGYVVLRGPSDHDLAALAPLLAQADAWIAGTGPVEARHLDAAPGLRIVARYGVGYEAVDVNAATGRGIHVTNTPGANSDAVADHAIGLMLAALRFTVDGDRRVRVGNWAVRRGRELGTSTVGIVGFGRIGQGVARRLSGFGTRVLAADPFMTDEQIAALGAEPATLASIAAESDIVSLHAPGGQLVADAAWLAAMKPGMLLVNTARPDLVHETTLADALRSGRLGGYAADTLDGDTAGSHDSPLLAADLAERVVITPHLGAQTVQAIDNMGRIAVENALAVLEGLTPPNPVNTVPVRPVVSPPRNSPKVKDSRR